jgi:hypothetical protein
MEPGLGAHPSLKAEENAAEMPLESRQDRPQEPRRRGN